MKNNIGLLAAVKLNEFIYYRCIIEVAKPFGSKFSLSLYARVFIEIIIIAKIIFIKKQVYLFTAITAKCFIIYFNGVIASFAAMVTGSLYGCIVYYVAGFIVIVFKLFNLKVNFTL